MPNYENNNAHGYLIITIDIQFPKNNLSEQEKEGDQICFVICSCKQLLINNILFVLDLKKIFNQSSINKLYNGLDGY